MKPPLRTVLLVDDDAADARRTEEYLRQELGTALTVDWATDPTQGLQRLRRNYYHLMVLDDRLGSEDGVHLLRQARAAGIGVPAIFIASSRDPADVVAAMKAGASDYLCKDRLSQELVGSVVRHVLELHRMRMHREQIQRDLEEQRQIMQAVLDSMSDGLVVTDANGNVLLANSAAGCTAGIASHRDLAEWAANLGLCDPETRAPLAPEQLPWLRVAAGHHANDQLVKVLHAPGGPRHFSVSGRPLRAGAGPLHGSVLVFRDVTEQRRAEEALRESEQRFRALFDEAPIGMALVGCHGRILQANRAFCALVGCTGSNDAAGSTFGDLLHPDDATAAGEFFDRVMAGECQSTAADGPNMARCGEANHAQCRALSGAPLGQRQEMRLLRRDGERVWVSVTATALRRGDGTPAYGLAMVENVTEQRNAAHALQESEEHFRTLAENAADLIFRYRLGPEAGIDYASPAALAITGYTAEELCAPDGPGLGIVHEADRSRLQAVLQGSQRLAEPVTVRCARKDGRTVWLELRLVAVTAANGAPIAFEGIARDVTEARRLQEQLTQAQKMEAIGQLAAGIAHEINTPIQFVGDNVRFLQESFAAIGGVLAAHGELLAEVAGSQAFAERTDRVATVLERADLAYLQDEIPTSLGQALEGIQRVAEIVAAMKEFAHPGHKEKVPTDVNRMIESTVIVARNEWKHVADVVLQLDQDLPAVPVLASELKQALLNLLVNAAQAIGSRPRADGEKGCITLTTSVVDGTAEIRIADTGTGIPAAVRDRVFDPFFTTKEVGKGTGQGLAIARSVVVDKHGGAIWFDSEAGEGTTFVIRLPLERQPALAR